MGTASLPSKSVPADLDEVNQLLERAQQGDARVDRTGVGTRSVFGAELRFDLSDGRMPLLTTKRVYWKTATREFLWFLTGDTNIRALCAQGVEIWTERPWRAARSS